MKNQELNLLYIFDAIMTEGSVTRAANRLAMTQPAVSNAVARMRDIWKDPLFIKSGRQIEPTAFALSLWDQVREPMHYLANAVNGSDFNPAESRRKFRVALSDSGVDMFWLPLIQHLADVAPMVDLYAAPFSLHGTIDQLREAQVDLAVGPLTHHDRSLHSTLLYETRYILAMGKHHPLAQKGQVTLEEFLAARHLLVTTSGHATGVVDQVLHRHGLRRRVAVTVNHFSAAPKLLINTDLIAVVPQFVAGGTKYRSELWLSEPPVEVEPTPVYVIWHSRHDRDPGLVWMREQLETIASRQLRECTHCACTDMEEGKELATLM